MAQTIDFITLGCSKNLVDTETLMGIFESAGFCVTHDSDDPKGEIAVVNTCGFIADAKEESINTILGLVQAKAEGRLKKLFVMGCLSERYLADLEKEIPEVDGWYGKFNYKQLAEDLIRSGEVKDLRSVGVENLRSVGVKECGSVGVKECGSVDCRSVDDRLANEEQPVDEEQAAELSSTLPHSFTPTLQKAHTPTLLHSNTPTLQKANTPTLLHSFTPTLPKTNTPLLRKITTPPHYAYIKISEGCDRQCAYCAIPIITGRHRSRPMEDILNEVSALVSRGVKEFQVIAQELTYYGIDLYGHQAIAQLVSRMADIKGVEWIRLHYAYPAHFPWELLKVMNEKQNVCRYLDVALQHISDNMLTRMRRHITRQETIDFISRLRSEVPGICLRTTLMVGFPGETDDDFRQLLDFTRWARFERMGAFAYSEEEGTYAADNYEDDVPEEVKQQRLATLMRVQQDISAEIEAQKTGQTLRTIIDRKEGDYYVGRTQYCSPEVDPEVLIRADRKLKTGVFYDAEIYDAEEFDVYARIKE